MGSFNDFDFKRKKMHANFSKGKWQTDGLHRRLPFGGRRTDVHNGISW